MWLSPIQETIIYYWSSILSHATSYTLWKSQYQCVYSGLPNILILTIPGEITTESEIFAPLNFKQF